MKFTTSKSKFLSALAGPADIARTIPENDSNRFILRNVKLEVNNNMLTLTGTDADIVVKNKVEVNSESDGNILILGQLIYDIINKLDDGSEIKCEYKEDEEVFYIYSGKSKFKLSSLPITNFPNFEEQTLENTFNLTSEDFLKLIDKCKCAICDEPSKYYLNGLFLHTSIEEDESKKLTAVSTDGHKLAIVKLNYFNGNQDLQGIIIPKKSLVEIRKMLALNSEEKNIEVFYSKTKIKIQSSKSMVISKLIDADFPDYKRVVPKENTKVLKCPKSILVKSIAKVSAIVNESHKGIKLFLTKDNLVLEGISAQNGTASDEISLTFDEDTKIEIAFNSKYLLEILSQLESDIVNIYFKDNFSAVIIKGDEENDKMFILMPVRI